MIGHAVAQAVIEQHRDFACGRGHCLGFSSACRQSTVERLWRGDLDEKFPSIRMRTDRRGFQVVPALIDAGKRYSQV